MPVVFEPVCYDQDADGFTFVVAFDPATHRWEATIPFGNNGLGNGGGGLVGSWRCDTNLRIRSQFRRPLESPFAQSALDVRLEPPRDTPDEIAFVPTPGLLPEDFFESLGQLIEGLSFEVRQVICQSFLHSFSP